MTRAKIYTLRTRFCKDIVAEFLPPLRKRFSRPRAVIICDGMPTVPSKRNLVEYFSKAGFWTFYPRYRGSWESGGKFLRTSPEKDIVEVLDQLPRGFRVSGSRRTFRLQPDRAYVIGGSFGGPAAILASRDSRIHKCIAVSPVVDWTAGSRDEPLPWLYGFVRDGFGMGYRVDERDWHKLATGRFYNPSRHIAEIDGRKIWLIHARDDGSVPYSSVKNFALQTGCRLTSLARGGHVGMRILLEPGWRPRLNRFLTDG